MDIKNYNKERLTELHNIISDGVLKAGHLEERIQSIFFAVMNPGDEKVIEGKESFKDRIVYTRVSYIMEPEKEIKTLEQTFGRHIQNRFLPGVFLNFARIIISTRLNKGLKAVEKWIGKKDKYSKYCDDELLLLRMCLYSNVIPRWLSDEDKRKLTREVRQAIILESEKDGDQGFTGRDSQRILGMLLDRYKNSLYINMDMVLEFFNKFLTPELQEAAGDKKAFKDFLIAIQRQYDYVTIQELKESLFYYNDYEIKREVKNYIHALNFDIGTITKCEFTGDTIEISGKFFERIEIKIFGGELNIEFRDSFQERWMQERRSWEYEGVENTVTFQEFTDLFKNNIKEKALDPYMKENDNYFRDAVLSYGTPKFEKFDHSIKNDIERMINNLVEKFKYTQDTAKEVCVYVIDSGIK